MRYEATRLRGNRYAVRPIGVLGTCGWINGEAWTVTYVHAQNARDAMLKFNGGNVAAYVSEGLGENIDFCPSDNS